MTLPDQLPLVKVVLVGTLILLVYVQGFHHDRIISRLAREKRVEKLQEVRRRSRLISHANLVLMLAILGLLATTQSWA